MTRDQAIQRFSTWVGFVGGQRAASRLLGCTPATVNYIVNGHRNVGTTLAPIVQLLVGIPHDAWAREGGAASSARRGKKGASKAARGRGSKKHHVSATVACV